MIAGMVRGGPSFAGPTEGTRPRLHRTNPTTGFSPSVASVNSVGHSTRFRAFRVFRGSPPSVHRVSAVTKVPGRRNRTRRSPERFRRSGTQVFGVQPLPARKITSPFCCLTQSQKSFENHVPSHEMPAACFHCAAWITLFRSSCGGPNRGNGGTGRPTGKSRSHWFTAPWPTGRRHGSTRADRGRCRH